METGMSNSEALAAINALRSNVVATQSAGWSNLMYPLVAILDAAGLECDRTVDVDRMAEHFDCYGGAGGYPGNLKAAPSESARNSAEQAEQRRAKLREAGMTV